MTVLKPHPITEPFPVVADIATLAGCLRRDGLLLPLVLFEGDILDGRARHQAMRLAGLELAPGDTVAFDGNLVDAVNFIVTRHWGRLDMSVLDSLAG